MLGVIAEMKHVRMQVKRNLHLVLSFSPVGGEFRERLRKFPSLVNCTTIDWFSEWPRDALHTVATQFLADLPGVDAKVRFEFHCQHLHSNTTVERMCITMDTTAYGATLLQHHLHDLHMTLPNKIPAIWL